MHNMRWLVSVVGLAMAGLHVGCAPTLPGTHVEVVQNAGRDNYVAGAAAPGLSQSAACPLAVSRAVRALALKFSQQQSDLGRDVAKAIDVRDGGLFLQQYAIHDAQRAAVQDISFDPSEHICMATVRWQPPLFTQQAVIQFAQDLKANANPSAQANGDTVPSPVAAPAAAPPPPPPLPPPSPSPSQPAVQPLPSAPPASGYGQAPLASNPPTSGYSQPPLAGNSPPNTVSPPPNGYSQPSPAPAPVAATPPPRCPGARSAFSASTKAGDKALADYRECLRRTGNDSNVCYRYGLYVEEAKKKNAAAGQAWADCVNNDLPLRAHEALQHELPGHAAKLIESTQDGNLVLWTYSPADGTAMRVEVSPQSHIARRDALPAEQVTWLRQQLAL